MGTPQKSLWAMTVIDKFPDWFPVLDGSRVSCMPCDQNQPSRQGVNKAETGSTALKGLDFVLYS